MVYTISGFVCAQELSMFDDRFFQNFMFGFKSLLVSQNMSVWTCVASGGDITALDLVNVRTWPC